MKWILSIIMVQLILISVIKCQDVAVYIPKMSIDLKSGDWYNHQADLWAKKLDKDIINEFAWLNYYKALRYAALVNSKNSAERTENLDRLNPLIDAMATNISDSWVYHYCKWLQGGNNPQYFPDLQKAFDIRIDYSEFSSDFVSYYESAGNWEKRDFFLNKWYESRSLSSDLLYYSYNVLTSLDSNSIIITSSDNDTYPLWMLQVAKDCRKDVIIINTSLIALKNYRDSVKARYKIKFDDKALSDDLLKTKPYSIACSEFIESLAHNNPARKIYLALTVDESIRKNLNSKLYVIGLAYVVSDTTIDNISILENNWQNFHLDYISFQVYNEFYGFNKSWLPNLNLNYITPAFALFENYSKNSKTKDASKLRKFIIEIAKAGGKEKQVMQYLEKFDHSK